MGRRRVANPKDIRIRITRADRRELALLKIEHNLPGRYNEGDVVHALLQIVRRQEDNRSGQK
jgi:hypothetical protein